MILVRFGNRRALDAARGTQLGPQITTSTIPDGYSPADAFAAVTTTVDSGIGEGAWSQHSADDAPAWVESTDADLAARLAGHYGCPVGRPEDWGTA